MLHSPKKVYTYASFINNFLLELELKRSSYVALLRKKQKHRLVITVITIASTTMPATAVPAMIDRPLLDGGLAVVPVVILGEGMLDGVGVE